MLVEWILHSTVIQFDRSVLTKEGKSMLVLSRKVGEEIIIADRIRVKVVGVQGNRVKLGIVAPEDVAIHRQEIYQIRREFAEAGSNGVEIVSSK